MHSAWLPSTLSGWRVKRDALATRRTLLLVVGIAPLLSGSSYATSWGLNSFADSVYWSDAIVVGSVAGVESVSKPKDARVGEFLGRADLRVTVRERLKGSPPERILVRDVDLGDPTTMASPYVPLPGKLSDATLLLFLRSGERQGKYTGYARFAVQQDHVRNIAFSGLHQDVFPLGDVRAMIAQLNLIQRVCPRDKHKVVSEKSAVAACRTALHSEYDQVVWYGARRLLDLEIPADFVPDLLSVLEREESYFPVGYLVIQCLAKTGDERAVPALIEWLEKSPRTANDAYVVKALKRITGEDFETSEQWARWWRAKRQ